MNICAGCKCECEFYLRGVAAEPKRLQRRRERELVRPWESRAIIIIHTVWSQNTGVHRGDTRMDENVLQRGTIWRQGEGHRHIWKHTFNFTLMTESNKNKNKENGKANKVIFALYSYFACHSPINIPQVLSAVVAILHGSYRFYQRYIYHSSPTMEARLPGWMFLITENSGRCGRSRWALLWHIERCTEGANLQKHSGQHSQARGDDLTIRLRSRTKKKRLQTCQEGEPLGDRQQTGKRGSWFGRGVH